MDARTWRRAPAVVGISLAGAFAPACGGDAPAAASGPSVRDSAGVEIVENVDAPGPADGWRVSSAPTVTLGSVEGDSAYLLFQVRAAARLSDGRIVVANGGTGQLRYFDADGRHLFSVGRLGQGPGEFARTIDDLFVLPGDTVAANEYLERRMSLFGPDGSFVSSFVLPGIGNQTFSRPDGVFADGSVLACTEAGYTGESVGTMIDTPVTCYRADREGVIVDTLGAFPTRRYFRYDFVTPGGGTALGALVPPFEPIPTRAVAPDRFYAGRADRWEIAVHAPDGRLLRLVRLAREPAPVTRADIDRYLEPPDYEGYDPSAAGPRARRAAIDRIGFPEAMPAYGELRVDDVGDLWVADYRPFGGGERRWTVFDPDGRRLGSVVTPPDLTLDQIGDDFVLGRRTDDLGVERVEVYGLTKRDGAPG